MQRLQSILRRIDSRGYKAYKSLEGQRFDFSGFELYVDHVQADPFAAPSRFRVQVPQQVAQFPEDSYSGRSREVALRDFLVRVFHRGLPGASDRRGTGRSGEFLVDAPGQEVLERSACQVDDRYVEMRFFVGLPAAGRRVLGGEAEEMLLQALPLVVQSSLLYKSLDPTLLRNHVEASEDADALRDQLAHRGLVAFIASGSVLPRRSGVDHRPLQGAVTFESPKSLVVEMELSNKGRVSGMGIPQGVTLIAGGGFHGKSTLLRALERGVYNHVRGDGRELVVTLPTAMKVRAEDGRSVAGVDISPFIGELPGGGDTRSFSTANASGSTSQAANIVEALESGSKLLLVDEDSSATNFMIRDRRMQALVEKRNEPITPFVDQVGRLFRDHGVSTVMVMGGSGDYFEVADTVISMVNYKPQEVTEEARAIARQYPTGRLAEGEKEFRAIGSRVPIPQSVDPSKGRRQVYLKARGTRALAFGTQEVDLSYVEQLIEDGQVTAIGYALAYGLDRYMASEAVGLRELIDLIERDVKERGLDVLSPMSHPADLVYFRPQELAAALNRLRTLRVRASGGSGT
ncbi:MAG: ABC-ATPase domain-containing protein [Dehalococcoidia bacterium]